MTWVMQKQKKRQRTGQTRLYVQVVWKTGGQRKFATSIGYADEHGDEDEVLETWHARLKGAPPPTRLLTGGTPDDPEHDDPRHADAIPTDPALIKWAIKSWVIHHTHDLVAALDDAEANHKIASGNYGALTLREYCERVWFPMRKRDNPGSWPGESSRWDVILEHLGHVRLKELNAMKWHLFLESQPTWGPTSKRIALNAYRVMLKHAHRLEIIDSVHGFTTIKGALKPQRDPDPLTPDETEALLNACQPKHRALYATGIGQALRPGELTKVRWEDIDWESRLMAIRGTKNKVAAADVPMTDLTLTELKRWWRRCGKPTDGWAFPSRDPDKPLKWVKTALSTAADRAKIRGGGKRVYPYLLRHTGAVRMAYLGYPQPLTRKIMRHSGQSRILELAYQKIDSKHARKWLDQIEADQEAK